YVKYNIGDLDGAFEDISKAISMDNTYYGDFVNRSSIYMDRKEYQNAINDANRAIMLDADSPVPYHNRGVALAETGDLESACADLNKAHEMGHPISSLAIKKYCKEK